MEGAFCFLLLIIVTEVTVSKPHFIASSKNVPEGIKLHDRDKRQALSLPVNLTTLHVTSFLTTRYARTTVFAVFNNSAKEPQKTTLRFRLPPDSYISNVVITMDDETCQGEVVERKAAKESNKDTKRHGNITGYAREVRNQSQSYFAVGLTAAPGSIVTFNITYEELLRRDDGLYTHSINIAPRQVVEDMRVDVFITEPHRLKSVDARWIPGTDQLSSSIESNFQENMTRAAISFSPTADQQKELDAEAGLNGRIVVQYEVMNRPVGGEIQINDGYFAHFISMDNHPPAPKTVVFVIDVSGSMIGSKLEQTKLALTTTLNELRDIDRYNILAFSDKIHTWKMRPVQVTTETLRSGLIFVESLNATGGTNIHDSLVEAASEFDDTESSFPVIVFMTDGVPSVGETNPDKILEAVTTATGGHVALHSVGFGDDVDEDFLNRLAAGNGGAYRKVTDDENAAVQMEGFFREVATPLLYNIKFKYEPADVVADTVTQSEFIGFFGGNEIVIAGNLDDDYGGNALIGNFTAKSANLTIKQDFSQVIGNMPWWENMVHSVTERIWAYLMIKELLLKETLVQSPTEKEALRNRALELSLEYQLLTPLNALLFYTSNYPQSTESRNQTGICDKVIGDPHFIIDIPNNNLTICFDVHGKDGTIVNLLTDPVHDILVNAKMIEFEFKSTKTKHSLFGQIGVKLGPHRIVFAHHQVSVDMEISHSWNRKISIILDKYNITIHDKENVTIRRGNDIVMRIQRLLWTGHPAHFNFFLDKGDGFSNSVHGILGQFQTKPMQMTNSPRRKTKTGQVQAIMTVRNKEEHVLLKTKFTTRGYQCWWAKADIYLDGTSEQYIVPRLFDSVGHKFV